MSRCTFSVYMLYETLPVHVVRHVQVYVFVCCEVYVLCISCVVQYMSRHMYGARMEIYSFQGNEGSLPYLQRNGNDITNFRSRVSSFAETIR